MSTVYIGLGTNVGDLQKNIVTATEMLGEYISSIVSAKLYTSQAMYYSKQADFLNTVICGETKLSPGELLISVKQTEQTMGRQTTFRNGPRVIDLDILFYDYLIVSTENLKIPHPLLFERDFVLKPMCDLNPDFVHPVVNTTVGELLRALPAESLYATFATCIICDSGTSRVLF